MPHQVLDSNKNSRFRVVAPFIAVVLLLVLMGGLVWFLWQAPKAPVIESLTLAEALDGPPLSDIALTEAGIKTVVAYGTVRSEEGCGSFLAPGSARLEARMYYSEASCSSVKEKSGGRCYWASTLPEQGNCKMLDCTDLSAPVARYTCIFPLRFFAQSTDEGSQNPAAFWVAGVRAHNSKGSISEERTVTAEVLTLTAIDVPATMDYGAIPAGGVSENLATPVVNMGNNPHTKLELSGTDFVCNNRNAPVSLLHYGLDPQAVYAARIALTKIPALLNLRPPVQQDDTARVQQSIHWQVVAPRGVGSDCKNRISIIATP